MVRNMIRNVVWRRVVVKRKAGGDGFGGLRTRLEVTIDVVVMMRAAIGAAVPHLGRWWGWAQGSACCALIPEIHGA